MAVDSCHSYQSNAAVAGSTYRGPVNTTIDEHHYANFAEGSQIALDFHTLSGRDNVDPVPPYDLLLDTPEEVKCRSGNSTGRWSLDRGGILPAGDSKIQSPASDDANRCPKPSPPVHVRHDQQQLSCKETINGSRSASFRCPVESR